MNKNLVAPSVFEFFRKSFITNLLKDELGDLIGQFPSNAKDYYIYRILKTGPDEFVDNIETPEKETLDDIILKSFKDCVASIIKAIWRRSDKLEMGRHS